MFQISSQMIFFVALINGVILITLLTWIFFLEKKIKRMLMHGTDSLGDSLIEIKNNITDLRKFETELNKYRKNLEKRVGQSIQAVETVRFSPFSGIGVGGNQSFSTSFVNEQGDGIVVSGLYYSKDRVSMFTKAIKNFLSEHDLTDEEKEVVERAKTKLKKHN
jgi:ElaB/YqjD/DUF883 family membrane-anchored ribosome-binding protein